MKLLLKLLLFFPIISFSQSDINNQTPESFLLDSINKQLIYKTRNSIHRISLSNLKTTSSVRIKNNNDLLHKMILKNNKLFCLRVCIVDKK